MFNVTQGAKSGDRRRQAPIIIAQIRQRLTPSIPCAFPGCVSAENGKLVNIPSEFVHVRCFKFDSQSLYPWPCGESPRYRPVLNFGSVLVLELSSRVWVASICAHRRVRSRSSGIDSAASHARLSLPPPARSCDKTIGVRAHAPHDTSRTSAKGPCGRHRRSPLRPRSTHAPAMPSEATGGWPGLHPPCVSSRAYHRTHYSAPGHMQRTHACARIPMSTSATSRIRTQHLSHTLLV